MALIQWVLYVDLLYVEDTPGEFVIKHKYEGEIVNSCEYFRIDLFETGLGK